MSVAGGLPVGGSEPDLTGLDPGGPTRRQPPAYWWLRTVRVVLVALVLAGIGLVLWQHSTTGTLGELRHDLARDRVRDIQVADESNAQRIAEPWRLPDRTPATPYVEWVTTDLRVHDAPLSNAHQGEGDLSGPIENAQDLPRGLRAQVSAWDDSRHYGGGFFGGVSINPLGLYGAVFLLLLLFGPVPIRGTKWAWFWFAGLTPGGLGLLTWLLVERPWSQRAEDEYTQRSLAQGDAIPTGRRSGWVGIGWGIVAYVLVTALATVAFWLWRRL